MGWEYLLESLSGSDVRCRLREFLSLIGMREVGCIWMCEEVSLKVPLSSLWTQILTLLHTLLSVLSSLLYCNHRGSGRTPQVLRCRGGWAAHILGVCTDTTWCFEPLETCSFIPVENGHLRNGALNGSSPPPRFHLALSRWSDTVLIRWYILHGWFPVISGYTATCTVARAGAIGGSHILAAHGYTKPICNTTQHILAILNSPKMFQTMT